MLDKHKINVVALQETKWFGNEVYRVGKSVILTAGKEIPVAGEYVLKGEGVALVVGEKAVRAWEIVESIEPMADLSVSAAGEEGVS